jgi:ABC-2 type transport system ATP-binding protein
VTILLTTHYLEEAQELCDRIAIINHGQVVACEEKETLLGRIDNKEIRFRVDREISEIPQALSQYFAVLKNAREIIVRFSPNEVNVGQIIEAVQKSKLGIVDVTTDQSDLEDVFLQLTTS